MKRSMVKHETSTMHGTKPQLRYRIFEGWMRLLALHRFTGVA